MKKMTSENKQLELPVLTDLNNRGGKASSATSVVVQPAASGAARNQPGSNKEASLGDLTIYQSISASYFSKRS